MLLLFSREAASNAFSCHRTCLAGHIRSAIPFSVSFTVSLYPSDSLSVSLFLSMCPLFALLPSLSLTASFFCCYFFPLPYPQKTRFSSLASVSSIGFSQTIFRIPLSLNTLPNFPWHPVTFSFSVPLNLSQHLYLNNSPQHCFLSLSRT